ncbi:CHAD domain-containing protein [Paenibacillus sp. FSL H8-0260]|uniref:CHAD domain-containing protein n=1 Tax=Paenibacillus sp. FSL H8-0260 TaxID=2921380 RepID=UPI00324772F6
MTGDKLTKERQLTKTKQWEQALNHLYINFWDYSHDALNKFADEDIHQARVNSRKLLSLLSILDPRHTSGLYPIFKKAQKRLGKVRDADVLIESFKNKRKQAKENGDSKTADLLKAVIAYQKDKRKTYRKKLAKELPELINEDLEEKWKTFLSEQLEALAAKKNVNVVMRELEIAYEQKKKTCKAIFHEDNAESKEAFDALHQLRIAAKELRYTASAADFAINQKFHAHEEIYKEIQDQLGLINDKRLWLETLNAIGREELDIGKKAWNAFTSQLKDEVLDALHHNDVIPIQTQTK